LSGLAKHLRVEEKVLWSGKPVRAAFVLPALGFIPFALFFLFIFLVIFGISGEPLIGFPSLFIGGLVMGLILVPVMWQLLRCRNTEYVITDQRIIIQSGAVGKDTRFVDLGKIQEAHVNVGFIDRRFGAGSILILSAGQVAMGNIGGDTVSWEFGPLPKITPGISVIRAPYEVHQLLQEAIKRAQTTPTAT
jgi:membrane protein YdbS with pleckstrin-like domain